MYLLLNMCEICLQDLDYLAQSDDERVHNMQDVDKLAELLSATR